MSYLKHFSRRHFLQIAGASTLGVVGLHGCTGNPPEHTSQTISQTVSQTIAPPVQASSLETNAAVLGFLPVVDCAPLVVAQEKGFFTKHGMTQVKLAKQASWAALRDNVELGSAGDGIDGGHFQSPVPELISEGIVTKGNQKIPMYVLARLNTQGVGISVANKYRDLGINKDSTPLKEIFAKAKAENKPVTCAITFPRSSIDLWLHYWLGAAGIDPTTEANILVIPPSQVVSNMKTGSMDIFCATDPWNARLVDEKIGFTAVTTGELWKNHPEKAFTMRADWVDRHPKAAIALLQAVLEAQRWCDQMENRQELSQILAKREYTGAPVRAIAARLTGQFDYGDGRQLDDPSLAVKFWSNDGVPVSYPFKSHDTWFLTENIRWGKLPDSFDVNKVVNSVNREDLWKEAAGAIAIPSAEIPSSSSRGKETFFDGITFDPDNPQAYLKSLKVRKV